MRCGPSSTGTPVREKVPFLGDPCVTIGIKPKVVAPLLASCVAGLNVVRAGRVPEDRRVVVTIQVVCTGCEQVVTVEATVTEKTQGKEIARLTTPAPILERTTIDLAASAATVELELAGNAMCGTERIPLRATARLTF